MILILKPKGRGNWKKVMLEITGKHLTPLNCVVGEIIHIGGVDFRIFKVTS